METTRRDSSSDGPAGSAVEGEAAEPLSRPWTEVGVGRQASEPAVVLVD